MDDIKQIRQIVKRDLMELVERDLQELTTKEMLKTYFMQCVGMLEEARGIVSLSCDKDGKGEERES